MNQINNQISHICVKKIDLVLYTNLNIYKTKYIKMNCQEMNLIETELGLELPNNFQNYSQETQELIINYLKHLGTIERQAYTIGKRHLGTSFNVVKSNGFLYWKKNNK